MSEIFIPVFRLATNYTVSVGRRWSILEQLILIELSTNRRSTVELAEKANLPERLVMEALINLLRAGWIEMRSTDAGVYFAATPTGRKRARDEVLPDQTQRAVRWTSLCVERLTGTWLRADDLDLVYENDLPINADRVEPKLASFDISEGSVRALLPLRADEGLEPSTPTFKPPSRPYVRVVYSLDQTSGLPENVPVVLKQAIAELASARGKVSPGIISTGDVRTSYSMRDELTPDDIVVGGTAHFDFLINVFEKAQSHVVLHSCFLNPHVLERLSPHLISAARRGVRVDLLWGLRENTETSGPVAPKAESDKVLAKLPADVRALVQLSPISSESHAKVLLFDELETGLWVTAIGSCNFLSSTFSAIEMTIASRSQQLAARVLSELIASQLPATGAWSATARRLNSLWAAVQRSVAVNPEQGDHQLTFLRDQDHYAVVTTARDLACKTIEVGCDLFGLAAKTSVLVPLGRAAEMGKGVRLFYNRPSKYLDGPDWEKSLDQALPEGVRVTQVPELHGKFLLWDAESLAVSSFNWLATVSSSTRPRGAEFGLLAVGPNLRDWFTSKLGQAFDLT